MSTSRNTSAASTTRSQTRNPPWSKEEDALVTQAILSMETSISTLHNTNTLLGITQAHPTPSASTSKTATAGTYLVRWAELATKLPGRTGKQIRDRWTNYLNPKIDRKPFTREEDEQLWHGQKVYGNKWVEISESVFEYKRSENQVKNRVCKNNVAARIFCFQVTCFHQLFLFSTPIVLQWNSAAFKTFIASEYGRNAYDDANLQHESSTPSSYWAKVRRAEHDSAKAKPSPSKVKDAIVVSASVQKVKDLTSAATVVAAAEEAYAAYSAAATLINPSAHIIITKKETPAADNCVLPKTTQLSTSAVVPAKKSNREMKRPPPIMTTEEEQGTVTSCTATLTHSSGNNSRQSSPKGRAYTKEEDQTITRIVLSERDFTHWSGLAADINALFPPTPGTQHQPRTGKQVRDRWVNFLNPVINHEPWSREESIRLWKAYAECGKRWTVIGIEKFHTTRSENQIKNRWNSASFKYFVAEEYGKDAYKIANDAAITPSSQQQQVVSAAVITPSSGSDTHPSINDGMKRKFFEIAAAEFAKKELDIL